tara:strand:+ start:5442 stop:7235 length:1794 start_codon:yes stop_codon:yes gene_type:complete
VRTFYKILNLLTRNERKSAALLLMMSLIMALLDTIGVASILPFIAVLSNPNLVETNLILNAMFKASNIFGVINTQQFLFVLGILVFLLLIISLSFKALTTYLQIRFNLMREYSIGKRLIEGYLHQPYSWFLNRHSAELGKTILSEVNEVVGSGLAAFMEVITKSMIVVALITLLMITDFKLALIVGFSISLAYGTIFYFIRDFLNKIGKKRLENNELRFKSISEVFGAVKEVKVGGLEKIYVQRFSFPAINYALTQASASISRQLPRFALEAIVFGGVMLLVLYIMTQRGSFTSALPIISLYVFAGYRLMPAFQNIYSSLTSLSFVSASLDKLYNDIKQLKLHKTYYNNDLISFKKEINLNMINYSYPNSSRTALKDISINIPINTTVGLIGTTGSGKTTLLDIILGLLEPAKGTLEVDKKNITEQNSRSWQRIIGYVPQHIFLADDTILANIAFGNDKDKINWDSVKKAAKIANLHEFVINELPDQYLTKIGERGIRLSGGQRQRIGIARALYHNPKVLILDEATSALDNETEKVVMDAVNKLNKNITIILVAHRLNTVKNCDVIFKIEKGKVIGQGSFDELIINNNDNLKLKLNK